MTNTYYFFEWYEDYEEISFQNMISKKSFDDFVERSKILPTRKTFYRMFILSKWKDDL